MRYPMVFLLVIALSSVSLAQGWMEGPPMIEPRRDAAVAVLDGDVYVIGGADNGGTLLGTVERLGDGGAWTPVASLRDARYLAAAAVYEGRIVLMGGNEDGGEATDDVEVYVPAEDDWESFQHLDQARQGLGAVVMKGKLYALGGATETGTLLTTCEYYEANLDQWYAYTNWVVDPRRAGFGIVAVGDVAYLAGGFGPFGPLNLVERYTVEGGTEILSPMTQARGKLALTTDGQALYAIGGIGADNEALDLVERYDFERAVWETIAPLNTPRIAATAAYADGMIYVAGGIDDEGQVVNSVEVLAASVGVEAEDMPSSAGFEFSAGYPNPFTEATDFMLRLEAPARLSIQVYDVRGKRVATLLEGEVPAGVHSVNWNGRAGDGRRLPSGVYVVRLAGSRVLANARVTLIR